MSFINTPSMPASQSEEGITLHIKFRPQQNVFTFTDDGIVSRKVIRVFSEHRALLDGRSDHLDCRVTYMLEDGTKRREEQLFATREDLIQSL